jgi:hypothetical protein
MEHDGPGSSIPAGHERARIVAEERPRHTAEMEKGGRDALAPIGLALIEKRFDKQAARETQDGHQQKDAHPRVADLDAFLAEVNLQLIARRRLHSDGGEIGRALRSPHVRHRTLHRAGAHLDAALGQQAPYDHRIALGWPDKQRARLGTARLGQPARGGSYLLTRHHRLAHVAPDRIDRHAQLAGDRLSAPAATAQLPNRRHDLAIDHDWYPRRR